MKTKEIEILKLKELKEKSKMLKEERTKGKVVYKMWNIVAVVILVVLAYCNKYQILKSTRKNLYFFLLNDII